MYVAKSETSLVRCIIYCRVSPTKRDHEGESFDAQSEICTRIANDRGWIVAHPPWEESFSGRKSERPEVFNIFSFLDKHPNEIQYCIFRSIDRFSRGGSYAYEELKRQLRKRGVELVDSYGIIQPSVNTLADLGFEYDWSRISPSAISEIVVAEASNQEVSGILSRMIRQEIRLTQRGYKIGPPLDGFLNEKVFVEGRKHVIQVPDPGRAKYLRAMFSLRASGQWTDKQICEQLNGMGYRTKLIKRWDRLHREVIGYLGGNPLTPKLLQETVTRTIYYGIVCGTWTHNKPIRAAYDGLVSIETFNAANRGKVYVQANSNDTFDVQYDAKPVRQKAYRNRHNPLFPFRGLVGCTRCRKPLYASSPRGRSGQRFPTYHCARNHGYYGVPKNTLEQALASFVAGLKFHPKAHDRARALLLQRYQERKADLALQATAVENSIGELQLRKADTVRAFRQATTDLMRRSLEDEAADIDRQIAKAETVYNQIPVSEDDIDHLMRDVQIVLEHPGVLLQSGENPTQIKQLHSFAFAGIPTYHELAFGTAKLSIPFSISLPEDRAESALVRLRGFHWNQIEEMILYWKQSAHLLRAALPTTSPKS